MESLVTMSEIARLAGVTRQAVTNWRRRPAVNPAFPSAVIGVDGIARFDREEVLAWLEETARGNNREVRVDAPAVIAPPDLDLQRALVLLGLRGLLSEDIAGMSSAQRVAAAAEIDPDDAFLLREVREAADDDAVAAYIDELLEASYGPSDALAKLYDSRPAQGSRGLAAAAITVLQAIADAARTFLGPDGVAIDLRMQPRDHHVAAQFPTVCLSEDPDREMLRHLALDGLTIEPADGPQVRVVSVVGHDVKDALTRAADIALELTAGQVAIVIGPAAALCDRLPGHLNTERRWTLEMDTTAGTGPLVAALKLPRGLWREAVRQNLGLWVLRGGQPLATGVLVADLSAVPFDPTDLADDVLGALKQTPARSYRYGRIIAYRALWTRNTIVVAGICAAHGSTATAETAYDRMVQATLTTREPIDGFDIVSATPSAAAPTASRSLGELIDAKAITMHRGSRIANDHHDPDGTLPVLSADPDSPRLQLDPFVAAAHYDHAVRTEPGDVVFTATPAPRAFVDEIGGSLVATPSRILRITTTRTRIGPHALATVINEMATSPEWRTWPVPHIPTEQVSPLEENLRAALDYHAQLRRHDAAVTDLITNLIHGVADGSVALNPSDTQRKAG